MIQQSRQVIGQIGNNQRLYGSVSPKGQIRGGIAKSTGGTDDYNRLRNQPSINSHVLIGDSDFEDIGLHFMTNTEIRDLLGGN